MAAFHSIGFHLSAHHSKALETLYRKFFGSELIRRSVRPQIHEITRAPAVRSRRFAAERSVRSSRTQKMKCRASWELSIGLFKHKNPLKSHNDMQIRCKSSWFPHSFAYRCQSSERNNKMSKQWGSLSRCRSSGPQKAAGPTGENHFVDSKSPDGAYPTICAHSLVQWMNRKQNKADCFAKTCYSYANEHLSLKLFKWLWRFLKKKVQVKGLVLHSADVQLTFYLQMILTHVDGCCG